MYIKQNENENINTQFRKIIVGRFINTFNYRMNSTYEKAVLTNNNRNDIVII